jgi:hypothetical protein
MTDASGPPTNPSRLRPALVLSSSEDSCTVFAEGRHVDVPYAAPFPRPRAERVRPGHLVALAGGPRGGEVIVWRWFDAVVLGAAAGQIRLWEPAHGEVVATPRHPADAYQPGSRAYLSAGLDGADWWVAGMAVSRAEDADVELADVERFATKHGLWDDPAS